MDVRKIVVTAAVVVPLVSAGVVFGLPDGGAESWRRMESWAEHSEAEWGRRSFERAPLWGEATAGNAFDDYAKAVELATEIGKSDDELLRKLRVAPKDVTADQVAGLVARWQPALSAMSAGAHRTQARPAVDWSKGLGHETARLLVCRDLVNVATFAARQQLRAGHEAEAVGVSLDALTFGTDLLQSPIAIDQMVACALVAIAAGQDGWTDEMLRELDTEPRTTLARGLATVDERCPTIFDFRGEALLLARSIQRAETEGHSIFAESGTAARSFEFGWSEQWAASDAVVQQVALWGQGSGQTESWTKRQEWMAEVEQQVAESSNPVLKMVMTNLAGAERSLRSAAVVVRLLRVAIARHEGKELELGDPLGDSALAVESQGDGEFVLRSAAAEKGNRAVYQRVVVTK